jgi:hypothetical protein
MSLVGTIFLAEAQGSSSSGTMALAIVSFVLGAMVTQIARYAIERIWKRPRPRVKIIHVAIGPKPGAADSEVWVPLDLVEVARRNVLLPELPPQITVRDLQHRRKLIGIMLQAHSSVVTHLGEMLGRAHLLPVGKTTDEQRLLLLREWTRVGPEVEHLAEAAIRMNIADLPAGVAGPHPAAWSARGDATVPIAVGRGYDLSEINEAAAAGQAANERDAYTLGAQAKAKNIHRRFWIRMDQGELTWLIGKTKSLFEDVQAEAQAAASRLDGLLAEARPDFLRVETLVTNDGDRAFAVRPFAQLSVRIGSRGTASLPLELERVEITPVPMDVIPGNNAKPLVYFSQGPIDTINTGVGSGSLQGKDIRDLYRTQVCDARVAVSLVGFGKDKSRVINSPSHRFGEPANVAATQELSTASRI